VRRRRLIALGALVAVAGGLTAFALGRGGSSSPPGSQSADATTGPSAAPPPESTTATPTGPQPPGTTAATVKISVVGDIVMGTPDYGLPPDGGASLFSSVAPLIRADVAMGNLEGTLATGGASKCGAGSSNCFAFRTPPSYARWLERAGFTVMNLANNHAYDFGPEGQRQTVAALDHAGLRHTGRPGEVARVEVRGIRVALVGFAPYSWANVITSPAAVRKEVARAAKGADVVVVMAHAGAEGSDQTHTPRGAETYLGEPRGDSRAFARQAIDAGADLVAMSGPHVMRGMEAYRGHLIAYSMGNFAGYKVFGLGGVLSTSGVLRVTLTREGTYVSGRLRPTELVGPGDPAPGGDAISLVGGLSRADFGASAARIGASGKITLPASG
jgi:Bacterial capsule synthesis protein PGA_cap